jgi:transposase-like protein
MEQWSPQHRAFIVEMFFKNGKSVIVTQRKFCLHFNVSCHWRIQSWNTILLWVHDVHTMACATKKKHGGSERTVRSPENVEVVRNTVDQSPRRSAVRHAQGLRLSDTTVQRILHHDFRRDYVADVWGRSLNLWFWQVVKRTFILTEMWINKTFVTGRRSTLDSCTNVRYIVIGLQFGLRWLSSEW